MKITGHGQWLGSVAVAGALGAAAAGTLAARFELRARAEALDVVTPKPTPAAAETAVSTVQPTAVATMQPTAVATMQPTAVATMQPTVAATPLETPLPKGDHEFLGWLETLRASKSVDIEALKVRLASASKSRTRVIFTLALAQAQAARGAMREAETLFREAGSRLSESHDTVRVVHALAYSRFLEERGETAGAVAVLAPLMTSRVRVLRSELRKRYFQALVSSGDSSSALTLWQDEPTTLLGAGHEVILDSSVLRLAELRLKEGDTISAKMLFTALARKYPTTEESRVAFVRLGELGCDAPAELFGGNPAESRAFSLRLVRDFGNRADLRQLGLSLASIDEQNPIPQGNVAQLREEDLSRLLENVEFLLQAWEYPLAIRILEFLRPFPRESNPELWSRILFLHGRALNQLERYPEAARTYIELWDRGAVGLPRGVVRERILLSLHYAGRYVDELNWLTRTARNAAERGGWDKFWLLYLQRRWMDAAKVGSALLKQKNRRGHATAETRIRYWLARVAEQAGDVKGARAGLVRLAEDFPLSHYAAWARWRLSVLGKMAPSRAELPRLDASRNMEIAWPARGEFEELDLARDLREAGFDLAAGSIFDDFSFGNRENSSWFVANLVGRYRYALVRADGRLREGLKSKVTEVALSQEIKSRPGLWQLAFPRAFSGALTESTQLAGGSDVFTLSIMRGESTFHPGAVSSVGALGLMQIMPRTGRRIADLVGDKAFLPPDLLIPEVNVAYGSWYLAHLLRYYQGNFVLAAAAYNAGPAAVDRWMRQAPKVEIDEFAENIPYDQTYAYIGKIMRNMDAYLRIYGGEGKGFIPKLPRGLPNPEEGMEMF